MPVKAARSHRPPVIAAEAAIQETQSGDQAPHNSYSCPTHPSLPQKREPILSIALLLANVRGHQN